MDLIDKITELSAQVIRQREYITTEEATKTAFVMPFINALGYNVFDPTEVIPEYTADVGTKKGEKVDYAVMKDGKPIILFEVKCMGVDLSEVHASQLYRYFSVTDARFAILTDGVVYRFYTDLDAPNKMDEKPFLVIDLAQFDEALINELKKFAKSAFDVDDILSTANDLKYTREIRNLLADEFSNPSEDFVRLFASQVYSRRLTQSVMEEFSEITKHAFRAFLNARIEHRLKTALDSETRPTTEHPATDEDLEQETEDIDEDGIVTTEEEQESFHIVRAILCEVVDPDRIAIRDVRSYCGILLDDNRLKPICRLHFNTGQKYIGLFDNDKQEERIPIENLNEIYQYGDRLKATVTMYEEQD
jgi:predicted type IV restriction endonuclease